MKPGPASAEMNGLVTFYGSFDAIRSERVLQKNEVACLLIPGPRDVSPHCGVALQFQWNENEVAAALLEQYHVRVESIREYRLSEAACSALSGGER